MSVDTAIKKYLKETHLSAAEICRQEGIQTRKLYKALKRLGIKPNKARTRKELDKEADNISKDYKKGVKLLVIQRKYKCSLTRIYTILNRKDVERRRPMVSICIKMKKKKYDQINSKRRNSTDARRSESFVAS